MINAQTIAAWLDDAELTPEEIDRLFEQWNARLVEMAVTLWSVPASTDDNWDDRAPFTKSELDQHIIELLEHSRAPGETGEGNAMRLARVSGARPEAS